MDFASNVTATSDGGSENDVPDWGAVCDDIADEGSDLEKLLKELDSKLLETPEGK